MGKLTFLFVVIFLVILGVLAFFNKGTVEVTVWQGMAYEVPVIALIVMSAGFGFLSVAVIVAIRDIRRYLDSWQVQRKLKREQKISDSFSKGLDACFASRFEESKELFKRVIEDDPSHIGSLTKLGDIAFHEGDLDAAREYYLRARELKPRSVEVLLALERVAEARSQWDDALNYVDELLDIDGENRSLMIKKREIFEKLGRWDDILDLQHKILKTRLDEEQEKEENRNLLCYKYESARDMIDRGETDRALKVLKGVLKADPAFVPAYMAAADAHEKNGSLQDVEGILKKGYEETSSPAFLARLETYFINKGEPGTIIDIYQKAVQKNGKDFGLQFMLAKLYYRLEMIDYAFETVNAMDQGYDTPGIHVLKAGIYERRAQHEQAVQELKAAINEEEILLVPYRCSCCGHEQDDYAGRCPNCSSWNTLELYLNESVSTEERQSST
jgi:lipopolysaccharide biosynthesis regulator YciM